MNKRNLLMLLGAVVLLGQTGCEATLSDAAMSGLYDFVAGTVYTALTTALLGG